MIADITRSQSAPIFITLFKTQKNLAYLRINHSDVNPRAVGYGNM